MYYSTKSTAFALDVKADTLPCNLILNKKCLFSTAAEPPSFPLLKQLFDGAIN